MVSVTVLDDIPLLCPISSPTLESDLKVPDHLGGGTGPGGSIRGARVLILKSQSPDSRTPQGPDSG